MYTHTWGKEKLAEIFQIYSVITRLTQVIFGLNMYQYEYNY